MRFIPHESVEAAFEERPEASVRSCRQRLGRCDHGPCHWTGAPIRLLDADKSADNPGHMAFQLLDERISVDNVQDPLRAESFGDVSGYVSLAAAGGDGDDRARYGRRCHGLERLALVVSAVLP
jgi:hypothetical protein